MTDTPVAIPTSELLPIRDVVRLTGVNPITLRAWERRYGLLQPTRTEGGHRLYSHTDVELIRQVLGWIERGVAVGKIGNLLARQQAPAQTTSDHPPPGGEHAVWQERIRSALSRFDEAGLENVYGQVFTTYPVSDVFQSIFMPVWRELSQSRTQEFGSTSQWLMLDTFLRGRALQRLQLARGSGRTLLLAPLGECHELELLVHALLLSSEDTELRFLSPRQPLDELPLICQNYRPQALLLYAGILPTPLLLRQLQRLLLAVDCPLAMLGEGAEAALDNLAGTPVACLGSEVRSIRQRLNHLLMGRLDT